jgi:hypothetical protein
VDWSGSLAEIAGDIGEYAAKQVVPLGIRNIGRAQREGAGFVEKALPMIGITPAPALASESLAERVMSKYFSKRSTPRTQEKQKTRDLQREAVKILRSGKYFDEAMRKRLGAELTSEQRKKIISDSKMSAFAVRFNSIPLDEALNVYDVSTPDERAQIKSHMKKKVANALSGNSLNQEMKKKLREELMRIGWFSK